MNEGPTHHPPIVDWPRAGRRLRSAAILLGFIVVVGAVVTWVAMGNPAIGTWLFGAVAAMFAVELVVVGGSAVRGLLRAGERGHRLARPDVSLLPARRRHVVGPGGVESPVDSVRPARGAGKAGT